MTDHSDDRRTRQDWADAMARADRERAVVLDGDRHESALCEKRGQFQEICGCGWHSSWTSDSGAAAEHADHLAAEHLWARLTVPQREVLTALVAAAVVNGRAIELPTHHGYVNGRSASILADQGYVVVRQHGTMRWVSLTARGEAIHPLSRCSARYGGKPCGYCHACGRRLPVPDSMACPACGATDYDE